jgi:hypothetical protein
VLIVRTPDGQLTFLQAIGSRRKDAIADREQVIGTLKAAFVQGLLDKDEFDLRVGQAFGASGCLPEGQRY